MAAEKKKKRIIDVRHPYYTSCQRDWRKWRLTYEGGHRFIRQYTKQFSKREDNADFAERLAVTYCPAYAKAAINEVKNNIFQRIVDVVRSGGSETYQAAVQGLQHGVDLMGSTMNAYIGRKILPELLTMRSVGVFVDMPPLPARPNKRQAKGKRPYIYHYPVEDILSWCKDESDEPNEYNEVLLCDTAISGEEEDGIYMPSQEVRRYRHMYREWDETAGRYYVWVQFYNTDCAKCNKDGKVQPTDEGPTRLEIDRIPFVMLEISDSLLADVADCQIALLNLASSDMAYALKSNFPFYTEQFEPKTQSPNVKKNPPNIKGIESTVLQTDTNGTTTVVTNQDKTQEVRVGVAVGRRYPTGTDRPGFIAPPSDPLRVSMEKQEQIKQDIRQLVNLAVSSLTPKAGADPGTEKVDVGLEAGLSYIGLELEHFERQVASYWEMYEGGGKIATVHYPENYSLKTDQQRRLEAADLEELMDKLPSKTAQKEIAKRIAGVLLAPRVTVEVLEKINGEIDRAVVVTTDPEIIKADFESGFVGLELASELRGYPKGEVEKAKVDHTERVTRIAIAQAEGGGAGAPAKTGDPASRGVKDASADPKAPKDEKTASRDNTQNDDTSDKTRGEGK